MNTLTPDQIATFHNDGCLVVKNVLGQSDVDRILKFAKRDPQLEADAKYNQNYEDDGIDTRLVVRNGLSDDIYSAYGRSEWIVGRAEAIFGERVRHFYHLNTQKEPGTGGWQYHQDYGYHYKEFLYPKFLSIMIALNSATKENGCLKVVRGSHKLGRIEHRHSGSQLIADPERVEFALKDLEEIHCELNPGDALFFDGNILHASDSNLSDTPRWAMIYAYVPISNPCVLDKIPEGLGESPVDQLDDAGVDEMAARHWEAIEAAIA